MDRQEDSELLMDYGVGFLAEGKPVIGLAFIHFAGMVSLKEKHPIYDFGDIDVRHDTAQAIIDKVADRFVAEFEKKMLSFTAKHDQPMRDEAIAAAASVKEGMKL